MSVDPRPHYGRTPPRQGGELFPRTDPPWYGSRGPADSGRHEARSHRDRRLHRPHRLQRRDRDAGGRGHPTPGVSGHAGERGIPAALVGTWASKDGDLVLRLDRDGTFEEDHNGTRAAANGTGVIAYSPMQSGLLTGAFTAERAASLGADDWRSAHADFTTGLAANLRLADALKPIAARHGVSVAEVAIAWVLAWPGISGAIVGARTASQVDGWTGAGELELTAADLDEIGAAITATGAGTGPAKARNAG
ncbi:aldo/keto reductase [Streptomyces hawaiiensis]|uniref:aldo/keto reductase n=1 Tax=Streptomyces hawaiiensis TaxID=67305 RepID=UPI003660BDFF